MKLILEIELDSSTPAGTIHSVIQHIENLKGIKTVTQVTNFVEVISEYRKWFNTAADKLLEDLNQNIGG